MLLSLNNQNLVIDTAKLVGDMLWQPKGVQSGKKNKNRKKKQKKIEKKIMREIIEASIIQQQCAETQCFSDCPSELSEPEELDEQFENELAQFQARLSGQNASAHHIGQKLRPNLSGEWLARLKKKA